MRGRFEEIQRRNEKLIDQVRSLTRQTDPLQMALGPAIRGRDAVVAHIEINDYHGVGVLLQRLFGKSPNVLSIRSRNFYGGRQEFGKRHFCISHKGASRAQVTWNVLEVLEGVKVRRVLAVPYFEDDALTAIALKECFGVPLCTFLMDDQNVCADGISDAVMKELLYKSSLRLAISPEMCAVYEAKYGYKVWFMPPVAPADLIPTGLNAVSEAVLRGGEPIVLGNIWSNRWLELLRTTVRGTGIRLRWHNNGKFPGLLCSRDDLASDGIELQEGLPEPDHRLVEILRQTPFVVLPSGTLTEDDDRRFIALLSFPSRIPYILATSHTPILVLGSADTAAARIVTRLGVGAVAPYGAQEFRATAKRLTRPDVNLAMRSAAFHLSERFTDAGALGWIWQSLERGAAVDSRYEDLISDSRMELPGTTFDLQTASSSLPSYH
ncbi:MAG TPA: hypothetical protein VLZ81_16700 [Blastocatellia bacterium]|nr:hypothetical protein [Blastocatellia bacterium]